MLVANLEQECREKLYGYFDNSTPYVVDMMAEFLFRTGGETGSSNDSSSSGVSLSTSASSTTHSIALPPFRTSQNTPNINTQSHQGKEESSICNVSTAPRTGRFFELCINHISMENRLGEIDVSNVTNDGELFCKIRDRYLSLRGSWARALYLRKPVDIHYVRVGLATTF